MLYKLKSKLLTILGDIRYFGWKNPFWFALNVPSFKLRGEHYRSLKLVIQPGDILLRGFEGYVDGWFIPGRWSHAGLYVGGDKEQVVHSMAEGVFIEDVLNFLRTDRVAVFRPPENMVLEALKRAMSIIGSEYDFEFDIVDNKRFYCSEVIDYCYPGLLTPSKYLFRTIVAPDDVAKCSAMTEIWNSEKESGQPLKSTKNFGMKRKQ